MQLSKTCPTCQKPFNANRLNQLYCGSICRSFKNNRLAKERTEETRELDKKLHINRLILKRIYNEKKSTEISKEYLLGAGFDFGLFTTTGLSNSIRYNLCFEFGITELSNNKFKIVEFKKSNL